MKIQNLNHFISPALTHNTEGKKGKEYASQLFANFSKILSVKTARIQHLFAAGMGHAFAKGEWLNNAAASSKLQARIESLHDKLNTLKTDPLSASKVGDIKLQLYEMQAICRMLKVNAKMKAASIEPIETKLKALVKAIQAKNQELKAINKVIKAKKEEINQSEEAEQTVPNSESDQKRFQDIEKLRQTLFAQNLFNKNDNLSLDPEQHLKLIKESSLYNLRRNMDRLIRETKKHPKLKILFRSKKDMTNQRINNWNERPTPEMGWKVLQLIRKKLVLAGIAEFDTKKGANEIKANATFAVSQKPDPVLRAYHRAMKSYHQFNHSEAELNPIEVSPYNSRSSSKRRSRSAFRTKSRSRSPIRTKSQSRSPARKGSRSPTWKRPRSLS